MECKSKFERDMNHNYLVLEEESFFDTEMEKDDYREKMIVENRIPGLLTIEKRKVNGRTKYYYDINQMQTLENLYEKNEMKYDELLLLLHGCVSMFHQLEEYLLEGEQIVLEPSHIYIHTETKKPYFLFVLWYEKDVRKSFLNFTDYLLSKIDHTEEKTVMLAYQVYKYTRTPNFTMESIEEIIQKCQLQKEKKVEAVVEKRIEQKEEIPVKKEEESVPQLTTVPVCEKETYRKKKAGFWMSILFSVCGILSYFLIYYVKLVSVSESARIYILGAVMITFVLSVLFALSMWKEQTRDDVEVIREESFSAETTCLCAEDEPHYFEGMLNGQKQILPITQFPSTIGKHEQNADIVICDKTVSRKHARIEKKQGKVFLSDLQSTNGTRKNGVYLTQDEMAELLPGDEVNFGGTSFIYI